MSKERFKSYLKDIVKEEDKINKLEKALEDNGVTRELIEEYKYALLSYFVVTNIAMKEM